MKEKLEELLLLCRYNLATNKEIMEDDGDLYDFLNGSSETYELIINKIEKILEEE